MRVVSSRELSSSLTRASASCSSDTSSSISSSPVALEFKIKGCHFKCFKLSILETVCVWVCVMILSEGIIAWSCLQKQLLQGRNTHLACSANSLKSSHRKNCQCSPLLIVINLGSQLSEMWTSSRNFTCHVFDIVFLWGFADHSDQYQTDPKSLFNRLLTHHLGRLLTQVQLQKLLKAHL